MLFSSITENGERSQPGYRIKLSKKPKSTDDRICRAGSRDDTGRMAGEHSGGRGGWDELESWADIYASTTRKMNSQWGVASNAGARLRAQTTHRGLMGRGGRLKREGIYVYLELIRVVVHTTL